MKKHLNKIGIFLLVILVLGLSGCKKDLPEDVKEPIGDTEENEDVVESEKSSQEILQEVLADFQAKAVELVAGKIDMNIGKVSSIEGDKMILMFEELLEDSIDKFTNNLMELDKTGQLMEIAGTERFFPVEKIEEIEDENLRKEVTKLYNSKYKLINLEGQYYPIIDYERFKEYNNSLSDEIKDYIAIMANTSNEPIAADGALVISFDELAARILEAENYIQRYSQGQKHEDILSKYRSWLNIYLQGLPNTPIADFETKEIKEDVIKSYVKTAKVKDSATAFVVSKYIGMINESEGIVNDDIIGKTLSLVNEALSSLETSK